MANNKPGVMIATPCYGGQVSEAYLHSILNTIAIAKKHQFRIHLNTLGNESLITRARNTLVSQFLDLDQKEPDKFSHLMFIDADIGFNGETIARLVKSDYDVVCGVYPRKSINWKTIKDLARKGDYEQLEQKALDYNLNFIKKSNISVTNGFAEVSEAATGFMCIKKEVFYKLKQAYPQLKYTSDQTINNEKHASNNSYAFFDCTIDKESNRYLSEDYAFCKLWRETGGKVHADLQSPITHYGTHAFKGNLWSKINQEK